MPPIRIGTLNSFMHADVPEASAPVGLRELGPFNALPRMPFARNNLCLSQDDSDFLRYLRGLAIIGIVVAHLGGWVLPPYSSFVHVVVPVFFFLSGSVSYYSFRRSPTTASYLKKRLVGLLIPYYLACFLSILVFRLTHASFPEITRNTVLTWLTIRPTEHLSGFPLGQVWFLHTLLILVLVSPFYFILYMRNPAILAVLVAISLVLAGMQTFQDFHAALVFCGHNLYKPAILSVFFVAGFAYFGEERLKNPWLLSAVAIASLVLAVSTVLIGDLRVDFSYHTYSPDLYYLAGSTAAIALLLATQKMLLNICRRFRFVGSSLRFTDRYTFGIFLLHSLAIWGVERYLDLAHPQGSLVLFAIMKFTLVMLLSCALAVPFGRVSNWLIALCLTAQKQPARATA